MNDLNKKVLKFKAIKEKLDWKGNVIEDISTCDYEWNGYDPSLFLSSAICKGDLSAVPPPTDKKYALAFLPILFKGLFKNAGDQYYYYDQDDLQKYKTIESEPVNGMKFVVYSRSMDREMTWTMERQEENE